eukprot:maker-scaffold302_size216161-snap-gene-1.10 protein:Tk02609 transcript:maker-scaffold302_size216161-snap-gene-1.10-mRNA-1 annotation:"---NA---"
MIIQDMSFFRPFCTVGEDIHSPTFSGRRQPGIKIKGDKGPERGEETGYVRLRAAWNLGLEASPRN